MSRPTGADGSSAERGSGGTAAGDRGRADTDPGRDIFRAPGPWIQAEVVQAADLFVGFHYLGEAVDDDAPAGPRPRVVAVGLEAHEVLAADAGQLRPVAGAEDHVLPVHDVVDRQDHDLAVGEETDPADRDRIEQSQAVPEGQDLKPGVVGRVCRHLVLRSWWTGYPQPAPAHHPLIRPEVPRTRVLGPAVPASARRPGDAGPR